MLRNVAFLLTFLSAQVFAQSNSYRILNAENLRRPTDAVFQEVLAGQNTVEIAQALRALGKIGHPNSVTVVAPFLQHANKDVRLAAGFAAGLLGGEVIAHAVQQQINVETDEAVRHDLFEMFARAIPADKVAEATTFFSQKIGNQAEAHFVDSIQKSMGTLNARFGTQVTLDDQIVKLLIANTSPAQPEVALTAAYALSRYRQTISADRVKEIVARFTSFDGDANYARTLGLLARVLGRNQTPESKAALLQALNLSTGTSMSLNVECLRALSNFPFEASFKDPVVKYFTNANSSVVAQAVQVVQTFGAPARDSFQEALNQLWANASSEWIKGEVLLARVAIQDPTVRDVAFNLVQAPGGVLNRFAITAIAKLGTREDLDRLVEIVQVYPNGPSKTAIAEALTFFSDQLLAGHERMPIIIQALLISEDAAQVSYGSEIVGRLKLGTYSQAMITSYGNMNRMDQIEARMAILSALGKVGDVGQKPFLERALGEDVRQVALAAADAYKELTGTDVSARVSPVSRIREQTPAEQVIAQSVTKAVLVKTNRGDIRLQMTNDAPLTATSFVTLVRNKFYDGLTFHRVVPNFVAQGGDPRGDGVGGPPDRLIREEISSRSHRAGTIGMATAGKDTGGSQWFVNLSHNLHLDGNYTIFADVVSGMEVAERLEIGDKIITAEIIE